jgi:hypothetical protein
MPLCSDEEEASHAKENCIGRRAVGGIAATFDPDDSRSAGHARF